MSRTDAAGGDDRVLSTMNRDGSRRWVRPRLSPGRFLERRRVVGWSLILLFTVIPYLRMNGRPLMLLDIARREFTLFGTTFLPTDTVLLMLLLLSIFVTIFLLTALFGRVWCGWACPQTIYLELVFRPIERWLEGGRGQQLRLDREGPNLRRLLKYPIYLAIAMFLTHTFLAYFVGVDTLWRWVRSSPVEHPTAFLIMAVTTLLMFGDFAYFREQTCIVACPYGRFQSVLLDSRSLIVGYDRKRGEPRGKLQRGPQAPARGDCVDCGACVITCPTGIDIREGLQMECVGCTQCIDACDTIMDRVGRPRGLIRYSSQEALETGRTRLFRPRIVAYPLALLVILSLLGGALAGRATADVTLLRAIGSPFTTLPSGEIANQVRIKIVNRTGHPADYRIDVTDPPGVKLVAPQNPLPLADRERGTAGVFVLADPDSFENGRLDIELQVSDGAGFSRRFPYRLVGPLAAASDGPS